ncbi:MAG TPA: hypothetical protein VI299_00430, partial [Polyangiales bacterium]
GLALGSLSPRMRDRVFRFQGALLPSLLESRARFGALDFTRTLAFSDELNYFPAIHLNQRGREPQGAFSAHEREQIKRRVVDALERVRDPRSGKPVVAQVHEREALFRGPFVERAPDLLLELRLDRGYSYNLMPSAGQSGPVWERLEPADYLGKKGRSLPGSHRPCGLFAAAGPDLRARGQCALGIEDASALVLARLGVSSPAFARGRVPNGWLDGAPTRALPEATLAAAGRAQRGALERRLRALGYID